MKFERKEIITNDVDTFSTKNHEAVPIEYVFEDPQLHNGDAVEETFQALKKLVAETVEHTTATAPQMFTQ